MQLNSLKQCDKNYAVSSWVFQAEFFSFALSVAFIMKTGFAMCFWKLCNNDLLRIRVFYSAAVTADRVFGSKKD